MGPAHVMFGFLYYVIFKSQRKCRGKQLWASSTSSFAGTSTTLDLIVIQYFSIKFIQPGTTPLGRVPLSVPLSFLGRHGATAMFRYQPTRALQCAVSVSVASRPQALALARAQAPGRLLSTTRLRFASKDTQDKESLKPRSNEYSKSGSDDAAASSDAAFNPDKTSPEAAEATAEREAGGKDNSLNVSPGNQKVSEPNDPEVGGHGGAPSKKSSGGGSAPKNG